MSYRPITDVWILARPKVAYYGAYPNGFLERARPFLPVRRDEPVLHVCGGRAKDYPTWSALCPNDVTCDLNPKLKPDVVWNVATMGIPRPGEFPQATVHSYVNGPVPPGGYGWRGLLIDRPYTEDDAEHYADYYADEAPDDWLVAKRARLRNELPAPNQLIRDAMDVLVVGGRVGMIDYVWPQPPSKGVKSIACVGVIAGFNNRMRCYSVFEKL